MGIDEIATKADIEAMEKRLSAMIKAIVKPSEDRAMSLAEACSYLGGMKPQTLRQKCCTGEIASRKAGGLKFKKKDLDEYLEATKRRSNAELFANAGRN